MSFIDAAAATLGPTDKRLNLLTAASTTESVNTRAFTPRVFVTVLVGSVAVRIRLSSSGTLSGAVDGNSVLLPANGRYDFLCDADSTFIYCESADGTSTHQVWVWESSVKC